MKVAITGANGFIGSYLAHYFFKNNIEVVALSKQFHPSVKNSLKGAHFFELNVLDEAQCNNLSIDADVLIHTATPNDIVSKNTLNGVELSVIGTKNIINCAIKNNIKKCIVFSTLQVYGTELLGELTENTPTNFLNDYGLNHLFAEQYAQMATRQGKITCVSVRPSNVYGRILNDAFNRWSLVPGCFCKEAIEQGTITLKSSGLQMRNFINLENLSSAVHSIVNSFPTNYNCYNLVSSKGYTMLDVAKITKQILENNFNIKIDLKIEGNEPKTTNNFNTPISKLQTIGFKENDNFTLETEITEIINYLINTKK